MSENAQATTAAPQTNAPGMRGEIAQKWPKFTPSEVTAKKTKTQSGGSAAQTAGEL